MLNRMTTAMPLPQSAPAAGSQRGVFLIEALLGILIFSLGILSLVAMQTAAISAQSDARYRIDAANLADQIVSEIWLNVNRPNPANATASQASVAAFAHHPTVTATCNYTGAASASPLVTAWAAAVTGAGTGLPGVTASMLQITVAPLADALGNPAYSRVTVTVCWQAPIDAAPHRHTLVALISY